MPVTTKIEPLARDIQILIDQTLSPQERSRLFAEFAEDQIEIAKEQNKAVLGRVPPFTVAVDGRVGAPLTSVRPDGVVFVEFTMLEDVLKWIGEMLVKFSPVSDPQEDHQPNVSYVESHRLYADGSIVPLGGRIPEAMEYVFVNAVPYARKIERGSSSQAPDGVYQAVSILARQRFSNIAKIVFTYVTISGGERNPAIQVKLR